jgi:hypothetical protein
MALASRSVGTRRRRLHLMPGAEHVGGGRGQRQRRAGVDLGEVEMWTISGRAHSVSVGVVASPS